ncbi:Zn-dependent hydrolase [Gemmatimonadota bacterium]
MFSIRHLLSATGITMLGLTLPACEPEQSDIQPLVDQYATVRLTSDLSALSERERQMIPILIEAAKQMDPIFWEQTYGNRDSLLASIEDPVLRRYVEINFGPWDRLAGDAPFVEGVGPKPAGANLYPSDITREEFVAALDAPDDVVDQLRSLYTLVRRRENNTLQPVPYHEAFSEHVSVASERLAQAAALADDPGLKRYLELRSEALLTDDFRESDMAWMDMKDNTIEVVIGPIETYEDALFGYKAAYESYVLIKDREWSDRLSRFAALLPDLQRGLPVNDAYKREMPGTDSDLNAYDVVYYAGDANSGSKTIAINLPNDEVVQQQKGARRLQLKNAMRAKFDQILVPIARELIADDQQQYVTFDAFFENTMFHEVAHGLGLNNTINDRGTVREALQEHASAIEEGKADILGLYMVTKLREQNHLTEGTVEDNYVTFMAGIFRSVRFGASSAHGRANMVRFHFFEEMGAFSRDEASGKYRVNFDRMEEAMVALSQLILTMQGNGDYDAAGELLEEKGVVGPALQAELDRLATVGIPVDIVFEQGMAVLEEGETQ